MQNDAYLFTTKRVLMESVVEACCVDQVEWKIKSKHNTSKMTIIHLSAHHALTDCAFKKNPNHIMSPTANV